MVLGCFEWLVLLGIVILIARLVRRRDLRWLWNKGSLFIRRVRRLPGTKLILVAFCIGLLFAFVLTILIGSNSKHTWFNEALVGTLFWSAILLFFWGLAKILWSLFRGGRLAACPSIELLKEFLSEHLPSAERVRLISHLESCTACQHRVEGLTAGQKSWPGMARKLNPNCAPCPGGFAGLFLGLAV